MSNPFKHFVKHTVHEVKHGVEHAGKEIVHTGSQVTHALSDVAHEELHQAVHSAKKEVTDAMSAAGGGIEHLYDITIDEMEKAMQQKLEKLFVAIVKRSLKKFLDILHVGEELLSDSTITLNLSILGMTWNDIGGRITDMEKQIVQVINQPPKLNKDYIVKVSNIVTPDRVGLAFDFKLAALVVTSDAAGGAFGVEVSRDKFISGSAKLLKAIGL